MGKIQLLDCTLRDGGYVNDWLFGHNNIVNLFERLVSAGVDMIEVGFLDERRPFDYDRTIMPDSQAVEEIYKNLDHGRSMLVGMIDYGTCGLEHILPCEESILDGIRVIFKKHLRKEAMEFCDSLKQLGYKVFAQLVSITSYTDDELMDLIRLANWVRPYAVSIVDTYGLMDQENLMYYFNQMNRHLDTEIAIGYHSHNNFQLAYANCIKFLEQNADRELVLDATVYGMGKSAGNAPIELLAMHMNQYYQKSYDTSQILEAIDSSVMEFYRKKPWGYSMFYYISAANDCHPNYVAYLMNKRTLSVQSISRILDGLQDDKKLLYDEQYIEQCYIAYQKNEIKDTSVFEKLREQFENKSILLLGPGRSLLSDWKRIEEWEGSSDRIRISINFVPSDTAIDYLFLTNSKRHLMLSTTLAEAEDRFSVIATSNVTSMKEQFSYVVNYSSLLDYDTAIVDNPLLMLLKILKKLKVQAIDLAGFDGYRGNGALNYIEQNMEYMFSEQQAEELNRYVGSVIEKYREDIPVSFLTDTLYEKEIPLR